MAVEVLAELERAENDVAAILNDLASRNGSDLAARRRYLAAEASAAAQHARGRARTGVRQVWLVGKYIIGLGLAALAFYQLTGHSSELAARHVRGAARAGQLHA